MRLHLTATQAAIVAAMFGNGRPPLAARWSRATIASGRNDIYSGSVAGFRRRITARTISALEDQGVIQRAGHLPGMYGGATLYALTPAALEALKQRELTHGTGRAIATQTPP